MTVSSVMKVKTSISHGRAFIPSVAVSGMYELSTSSLPNVWPPPVKTLDDLGGAAGGGPAL